MRAVVDDEAVVAIDGQPLEPEHEPLEDALRLEGEDAVDVALVGRSDDGAVDRVRDGGEEAAARLAAGPAQLRDCHCKKRK